MDDETKAQLVAGINLLIKSPNAHALYETMRDTAPLMARHKDLRLTGEATALNTLALTKVARPDVYATALELVASKREEAGLDSLEVPTEDKFDKAAYMQQFMEQKRLRQRRAADIENLQRGERDKLVGRARMDFMQRQSGIWKRERDEFLERAKTAAEPRRLKKEDITLAVDSFWQKVDAKLDALEHAARSGKHGRTAASLEELEMALRHDPYKK